MGEHHDVGPSSVEARVAALEAVLVERGLITSDTIEAVVQAYEQEVGPHVGARVVARAWTDPGYRERLLTNGTAAIAELGVGGAQGEVIVRRAVGGAGVRPGGLAPGRRPPLVA
jgi:nitrile hydratase